MSIVDDGISISVPLMEVFFCSTPHHLPTMLPLSAWRPLSVGGGRASANQLLTSLPHCHPAGQVFWTQRKSTPDLGPLARKLADDPDADIPSSIGFDSLKSLPTTLPWLRQLAPPAHAAAPAAVAAAAATTLDPGAAASSAGGPSKQLEAAAGPQPAAGGAQAALPPGYELMRRPTFEAVATALRQQLGLTLFGFDLVFDRVAGKRLTGWLVWPTCWVLCISTGQRPDCPCHFCS